MELIILYFQRSPLNFQTAATPLQGHPSLREKA